MSELLSSIRGKALLAPLAGITNLPFRLIARSQGCECCFTEMISATGLIRDSERTLDYMKSCPEDTPLGFQIFGADPSIMAEAAKFIAGQGPDLIDINMGCPVRKVIKSGAGAKLMKDPALAGKIIESVVSVSPVPVTVKIRAGWSRSTINAIEMAVIAEASGASAVIVHGRTADQGFSGHADWAIIAAVKNVLKIPVIGNGDIWQAADALKMLEETGCDAVLIGRGALGNPWIFNQIHELSTGAKRVSGPTVAKRYEIIKKHWELESFYFGERLASRTFRKHLLWYTKGLPGSGRFRELVGKMKDHHAMLDELERYFTSVEGVQSEIRT